jgi:hypothetical protein
MEKIISEDALRRSLSRMSAEQSQAWLGAQLLSSVQGSLSTPWILDIDTTIKTHTNGLSLPSFLAPIQMTTRHAPRLKTGNSLQIAALFDGSSA